MGSEGLYTGAAADEAGALSSGEGSEVKQPAGVELRIGGREVKCNAFGAGLMTFCVGTAFVAGLALGSGGDNASGGPAPAPAPPYGQPAGPQTARSDSNVDLQQVEAGEVVYEQGYQAPVPWAPLPLPTTQMGRIAFGSCANQAVPQPFWDTLNSFSPQLYIMGGDNVYGDCLGRYSETPDADCDELGVAYRALDGHPSFRGIKGSLPMVATWDDHDGGLNDRGAEFPYQEEAKAHFMNFFSLTGTDDPRNTRAGVYHSYSYGPPGRVVQIVLLDCRSFRSPLRPTDEPHSGAP
eukprot:COSAG02_NODE_1123_length_14441_cov_28.984521_13_plen_294_part_00